jgi:hypothetical protein
LRAADLPMLGLLLRPFRCLSCKHRFYRPFWATKSQVPHSFEPAPLPRLEREPDLTLETDDRSDLMLNFDDSRDVIGLDFDEAPAPRQFAGRHA